MTVRRRPLPGTVTCILVLVLLLPTAGGAEEKDAAGGESLDVVATLGKSVKDSDFHEITYYHVEGRKRKKIKALVKIPESLPLIQDIPGRIAQLKEGDVVLIWGKPEEREVVGNAGGVVGVERYIKQGKVLLAGKGFNVDLAAESDDPREKGFKWCEAQVEKAGKGNSLSVTLKEASYRVSMDKSFRMIVRTPIPEDAAAKLRKRLLRSGASLILNAKPTADRPEGVSDDDDRKTYEAKAVVIVPRSLSRIYGTMVPVK